jgi:hypothetical protein
VRLPSRYPERCPRSNPTHRVVMQSHRQRHRLRKHVWAGTKPTNRASRTGTFAKKDDVKATSIVSCQAGAKELSVVLHSLLIYIQLRIHMFQYF